MLRKERASRWRVTGVRCFLAVCLSCALVGSLLLWQTSHSLRTPVWGVTLLPEWTLVRGTRAVAVVTLAVPDVRHAAFLNVSLQEKTAYALVRGYWFVAATTSLDDARTPVWSKLRLLSAVLEQARAWCEAGTALTRTRLRLSFYG